MLKPVRLISDGATGISCFNASGDPVICATQFVARQVGPCSPASVTYKLPFASKVFVGTDPGSSVLVSTNFVSSDAVVDCAVVRVPSQFGAYTFAPPDSSENVIGPFPPFAKEHFGSQLLWFAIAFALLYFLLSWVALPRVARAELMSIDTSASV